MACTNCKTESFNVFTVCRCCQLVDNDRTLKWTSYCSLCGVMLCSACAGNPIKRAAAAVLHGLRWRER